jgi:multimeric flavodoxin WrbA
MLKQIAVINGSPRENGNTDVVLKELIKGAKEAELETIYLTLRDLTIADCIGCCKCRDESVCHFQDDMNQIRDYLQESDLLIFASPNYWCEITGLMKTCMDRLYFYHHPQNSSFIAGKKAIVISTMGEAHNIDYEAELLVEFFRRALKSLGIQLVGIHLFYDLMEKGAIFNKPEYLKKAYNIGKSLQGI